MGYDSTIGSMSTRDMMMLVSRVQWLELGSVKENGGDRISGLWSNGGSTWSGKLTFSKAISKFYVGGIWLLWESSITIEITHVSNQFVNTMVDDGSKVREKFQLTAIYASPLSSICKHLWNQLSHLKSTFDIPWMLGGDFNALLAGDQRVGVGILSFGYIGKRKRDIRARLRDIDRALV
ncbi:hypothetical protein V6N11_007961 [Hibiscus sabdariffa]|uniref:Endonuclease/exonuclease/phosphatase domain-containing protein n=1 Tax=Hibiscus sabdariffa TaxID=183260 RepID=A0ABR2PZ70_9ROSI